MTFLDFGIGEDGLGESTERWSESCTLLTLPNTENF